MKKRREKREREERRRCEGERARKSERGRETERERGRKERERCAKARDLVMIHLGLCDEFSLLIQGLIYDINGGIPLLLLRSVAAA